MWPKVGHIIPHLSAEANLQLPLKHPVLATTNQQETVGISFIDTLYNIIYRIIEYFQHFSNSTGQI